MSDQTKTTTGQKPKTTDYITQLKKESEGAKDTKGKQNEEIEWDRQYSEDEEEAPQDKKGVIIKQGVVGTDKPKKLRDLFADTTAKDTKTRTKQDGQKKFVSQQQSQGQKPSGDVYQPKFTNSRGVQNKDVARPQTTTATPTTQQPKFTNTRGIQNKDTGVPVNQPIVEEKKKFVNTGALLKASEENAKIRAPAKDYLEAEGATKYKEEIQIEKPKFMSKNVEGSNEPHFREINKQEDLFLKKLTESTVEANIYSEPRTDKDFTHQTKPYLKKVYKEGEPREYKEKREFKDRADYKEQTDFAKERGDYKQREFKDRGDYKEREPREPREQREYKPREKKPLKEEKEVDSDGFEIVEIVKTKPEDFKPKKRYTNTYNNDNKTGKRPFTGKRNIDRKENEEKPKQETQEPKTETTETIPAKKAVVTKATVTLNVDPQAKKLRDLF